MDKEKKFKYYFQGKGYNSKRALSHGMTEEFLSEYGLQLKEKMLTEAIAKVKNHTTATDKEASRKVFFGFSSNDVKAPNSDLQVIASLTNEGNYIYMEAFQFSVGGSIISLGKEKLNEKTLKGGIEHLSMPTPPHEVNAPQPSASLPEEAEQEKTAIAAGKGISADFRVRD